MGASGGSMRRVFVLREQCHVDILLRHIAAYWQPMSTTKHPMQVECAPESTKRSSQANRYYWQVLHQIEEQAWIEGRQYQADPVWHEMAKRKFIGVIDLPGGGSMGMSTTELSTSEFAEYVTKVEAWAQCELGVELVCLEPMGRCA